ncbi:MAG TPA: SLC13 family permease [Pseudonocardiaceae bacterium]
MTEQLVKHRGTRFSGLDWIAVVLLAAGSAAVATGLLPLSQAEGTVRRLLPLLLFLATVVILAELTAKAEVFDVIAARVAIAGRGRYWRLFGLGVLFAAGTTAFLNLDTTAVLLTPVMLATAVRAGMSAVPLAMTTVWLANTASLLLPVSNLTNLLAADRVRLAPVAFAARMVGPQLASVAATMVCLWVLYWRRGRRGAHRYTPPAVHSPRDRVLFGLAALACLVFVSCVFANVEIEFASTACAAAVLIAFAVRARDELSLRLFPWRLLVFVVGLFLVIDTLSLYGLAGVAAAVAGTDPGPAGMLRAAGIGAGLSNAINNLPAYATIEAVIPVTNHDQLLALLVGTNVGPIVTPWASLATLLWYERCRAAGVQISWRAFAATGLATTVVVLAATTGALIATG